LRGRPLIPRSVRRETKRRSPKGKKALNRRKILTRRRALNRRKILK
jgi:hypothetical protein